MGYSTRFELQYDFSQSDQVELDRLIEDMNSGKTFGSHELSLDFSDWESMKWYDYDNDMKELSREYPNVMLVLSGEGEEPGDLWRAWYMNGDSVEVQAVITYPEPDFTKFSRIDLTEKRTAELEEKRRALLAEQARVQAELDRLGKTE
jgi:hypothetical protein